jgi:hypothetical protein
MIQTADSGRPAAIYSAQLSVLRLSIGIAPTAAMALLSLTVRPIWRVVSPQGRFCSGEQNSMIGGSQSIFAISLTSLATSESAGAA